MKIYLVPINAKHEPTSQEIAEALAEMQLHPGGGIHLRHDSEFCALLTVDWQLVLPDEEDATLTEAEYEAYYRHHAPVCVELEELFHSDDPGDYRPSAGQLERIRTLFNAERIEIYQWPPN